MPMNLSNTQKKDSMGYIGGSIFSSIVCPLMGSIVIGGSSALTFTIGGCILALPVTALALYLDNLKAKGKLSNNAYNICTYSLFVSNILSSAVLGAAILGSPILPALISAGIGIGVLAAVIAVAYLGNKLFQHFHQPQLGLQGTSFKP